MYILKDFVVSKDDLKSKAWSYNTRQVLDLTMFYEKSQAKCQAFYCKNLPSRISCHETSMLCTFYLVSYFWYQSSIFQYDSFALKFFSTWITYIIFPQKLLSYCVHVIYCAMHSVVRHLYFAVSSTRICKNSYWISKPKRQTLCIQLIYPFLLFTARIWSICFKS